jgi:hypothetical protein
MNKKTGLTFRAGRLKIPLILLAIAICLQTTTPALAFPPLPSGFYGTVNISGRLVPDGTLIRAIINGIPYAEAQTLTYQGSSVFSMSIPGDDLSTTIIEGGKEGDVVNFTIGNLQAEQVGTWHSGTNVLLDLNATGFFCYIPMVKR